MFRARKKTKHVFGFIKCNCKGNLTKRLTGLISCNSNKYIIFLFNVIISKFNNLWKFKCCWKFIFFRSISSRASSETQENNPTLQLKWEHKSIFLDGFDVAYRILYTVGINVWDCTKSDMNYKLTIFKNWDFNTRN